MASDDGSDVIQIGGVAQLLFEGAIPKHGWEVCNVDGVVDLWASDSTLATTSNIGSIRIAAPGGTYVTPRFYVPLGPVSVVSPKTGHKFTARRW